MLRVRGGRAILALSRWRLSKEEIDEIANGERLQRFVAVQELRRRRDLPQWVLFEELDNSLPVDLDNPLSVDAFVHVLKRGSQAVITEMYPTPDQTCVSSDEGRFCHELDVPLTLSLEPHAATVESIRD